MKTITFLIVVSALTLLGCSKNNPNPQVVSTWILGKWERVTYGDTTYYNGGAKTYSDQMRPANAMELNFISTNQVTQNGGSTYYQYSLPDMDVHFYNTFKITKISDTKMKLDYYYYANADSIKAIDWADTYIKKH